MKKKKFIFLFFFLNLYIVTKSFLNDEINILTKENKDYLQEKISEIKKDFNISINILLTDKTTSLEKFVKKNKKSIFIFLFKEKDIVKYSIFLSKDLINFSLNKEVDILIEREITYLLNNLKYFDFLYTSIGRLTDIYIANTK